MKTIKSSRVPRKRLPAIGGRRIFMRILICLGLVFAVASTVALYFQQEVQLQRVAERKIELQNQLAAVTAEQTELLALQMQVDTDAYIEHVARENLGMVKPNELVFEEE